MSGRAIPQLPHLHVQTFWQIHHASEIHKINGRGRRQRAADTSAVIIAYRVALASASA